MSTLSVKDVQVVSIVPTSIACIVTTVRLVDRIRYRRFWCDDAFAALSMVSLILVVAAFWSRNAPAYTSSYSLRLGTYYIDALGFYTAVWGARFSILFTVIRVAPTVLSKRWLYGVAISFGIIYVVLFAQVFWRCVPDPGQWEEDVANAQCILGTNVAIAQLITDILADLTLIFIPVKMLWHVRIGEGRRLRLMSVFIASIATTVVSLVHAAYILVYNPILEAFTAIFEDAISLIVCNLAVIVAMAYRTWNKNANGTEVADETPTRPGQTTLDFRRAVHLRRFEDHSSNRVDVGENSEAGDADIVLDDMGLKRAPVDEESLYTSTTIMVHEEKHYEVD